MPKLHFPAAPGFLTQVYGDEVATWPSLTEHPVAGIHFVQEDSGDEMGRTIAAWLEELG